MDRKSTNTKISTIRQMVGGVLRRLVHDRAGNTIALIAASTAPLLALVGGGIDMSRSYLSQARLQQACDAGVLAARKKLGSSVVTDGIVPVTVVDVGNRFFNLNYRDGAYGTAGRTFTMGLEDDYAISGEAHVDVPTTIMAIFGTKKMSVNVNCEAALGFSDTDVMFVLDTTGSMDSKNPGDSLTRIQALRDVVKSFHAQLEGSKAPNTRIRYGFVPYSVNVNVGHLLEDDWVVDEWTYQSREQIILPGETKTKTKWENWVYISGGYTDSIVNSYPATFVPGSTTTTPNPNSNYGEGSSGNSTSTTTTQDRYVCKRPSPRDTLDSEYDVLSTTEEPYAGPPEGTRTTVHMSGVYNGRDHWTSLSGQTCEVFSREYNDFTMEFDKISYPASTSETSWMYKPVTMDVSNWRSETDGCIEERDSYEIYSMDDTVDFSRALDLNIDAVPIAGSPSTQWRPMYPDVIWARALMNGSANNFKVEPIEYDRDYFHPADHSSLVACPVAARKLAEMNTGEVSTYMESLSPEGQTYHDIGMIWGGRLLSPTGIFESENADQTGKTTTRHLIFLTDGHTQPLDISYTSYGLEPIDQRRWTLRPDPLLDRTIEMRFGIACREVKKRNITVWVVGFGTSMNDIMKQCAGDGHWFQAEDSAELAETFNKIAKSMGELRVSR
ncbi:MAG: VWA domain-containing protein [Sphingomonadaceae bacterium]|nr:VWA domain-containing protein [Sphingomonadaceae bacterium]